MHFLTHSHFSDGTLMLIAGLMIAGGLVASGKLDVKSAIFFIVIVGVCFALRDSLPPKGIAVLFLSLSLGGAVLLMSRMPGGFTWFRFLILIIAVVIGGFGYYIHMLPQVLGIMAGISLLVYLLFFRPSGKGPPPRP